MEPERATFAAGCFWGVEAAFAEVAGVVSTRVGYTGGTVEHPTYEQVCTGRTGHAEAVEVTFDPMVVGYDHLLIRFWSIHDPTTKDRQGPDVGTQYRSAIFTRTDEQFRKAVASLERMNASGRFGGHIVTEILPADRFWPAEEYHQQYFRRNRHSCGI
ncbi:MAG: peptide-methionine (S)-S-oxide reductase MsrA [Methanocalculus sp.]|uniref:peptide-methionine (S)-S-oxide reductase MsrA n=1 Tax=Methanocalculus sp. TaxID=2004547 RepID=UPI0027205E9A|nr:peptide-methionine (S)-S-oxide reductase MsrA [Methanocalculus sp.]MDO9539924.1 peptide-methionine (S)-S-oxide reductase MsrA [Methanocalculus sp.]